MSLTQPRNYLITDVELNWARLDTPSDNPFGGAPNWELQIATTDADKAKELTDNFLNVKEADGKFTVSLRRKSVRNDGSVNTPVRVVNADKTPIDGTARRDIGNGSTGNVIVWQAPYTYNNRKGITNSLTAVQITNMELYTPEGNVDFDMVGGATESVDEIPLF